jgi:two-component system nitrogen regulation response regulator NtrX
VASERKNSILICDDEVNFHLAVKHSLRSRYEFRSAYNGDEAITVLRSNAVDLLLLDLSMRTPDEGFDYLPRFRELDPELPICIFSGRKDFETARRAVREGVLDFIPKDFAPEELDRAVQSALAQSRLKRTVGQQRLEISRQQRRSHPMLGNSSAMQQLRRTIEKIRRSSANVLIQGETGTGKEVVARQIRESADGGISSFVAIDSATIQASTAESILFGHEKGAFTGADRATKGLFEEADGGIIYFDEIGNMSLEIQSKLLRVMQEREVLRLGSSKVIPVDFRVIGATNKDLSALCAQGLFKDDLLQRINVLPIEVPPLRSRKEDIPLLASHFLDVHSDGGRLGPRQFSDEAMDGLIDYQWPGNIRELSNVVAFLVTMAEGERIEGSDLPAKFGSTMTRKAPSSGSSSWTGTEAEPSGTYQERMRFFERRILQEAYAEAEGNVSRAALSLGIDRSHLHSKLKEFGIHSANRKN